MHDGEVTTDVEQVRRLVADQFPQWASLLLTPLPLSGTDHSLYRLGDELVARLPRIDWALDQVETVSRWLPVLSPHLPLPVPANRRGGQAWPRVSHQSRSAAIWAGPPGWVHGDLQSGNLLVEARRLSAVIDFGGLGLGDLAVDLLPAWNLFDRRSRSIYREALDCDDTRWAPD